MQAIILAAGMGKRLGELTSGNTKCMIKVNGVTLIERMLRQLDDFNLNKIILVVGYEGQKLCEYISTLGIKTKIEYVENTIYDKTNNIYSLALAKRQLQEDDTLLLESDLIFDSEMLNLILENKFPNLALVAKYETWMDGTMVCVDEENDIVNFVSKDAFRYDNTNEYYKTVNIYKFSKCFSITRYVPFLDAYIKAVGNNEYYENVLRILSFLNNKELKALQITTEKWYEIDDKQDLDIAEAIFAEGNDKLRKFYSRFGGYWRFPKMLDFCYLVNPYFRSSSIIDEMQANFRTLVSEYPSGMAVNSLLASKCWGVKEEYIVPGNGAAELIKELMDLLPGSLGIVRPTFEEYPNRRDKDSLITFIPNNIDFRYTAQDLMDFFGKHSVDNLLLINPDNPSGNFISFDDLCLLAEWCEKKGIRFILDESFVDFSVGWKYNTLIRNDILEKYPNMLVMKSISKSYGVPGLRLGILCSADMDIICKIKRKVSIWNLNSFCEFFMQIYSKYEKDYYRACDKFIIERNDFEAKLRQISFLRVIPSQANYFLVEVLSPFTADNLVTVMLSDYNILMRNCSLKGGFDGKQYMRIAVRGHEDNTRLIECLKLLENKNI